VIESATARARATIGDDRAGEPLVDRRTGAVRVGAWRTPLVDPNIEDARFPHALSALARVPGLGAVEAAYRKRLRLKIWQYMSLVTDGWFVAFAVADAGFAGNAFVYATDLRSGRMRSRLVISPLGVGARIARTTARGSGHRFRGRDLSIDVDNRDGRSIGVRADGRWSDGGDFALDVELDSAPADDHLALCVPLATGRWGYTHKFGAYRVRGRMRLAGDEIALDPSRTTGTLDYSKMYALRHAVWKWIAVCGRATQGPLVGINLVDPTPDAPVSENGAWIDGQFHPLDDVTIATAPWRASAGGLSLSFTPVAEFEQRLDLPLLRHRLRHHVGTFTARITTRSGVALDLVDAAGVSEDNDTWW
jgi:hypothetical protein